MSTADQFDHITARARADTACAVQMYHDQLRAITERLRITSENAVHRRGITREALADDRRILLPAEDIDLSPHTPVPAAAIVESSPGDCDQTPDAEPDFSFSSGWLSDR